MTAVSTFPDESRVWIYQADRPFSDPEIRTANEDIQAFCRQWTSHNNELKATGSIVHHQFVVLVVDETQASTSGCSIDKSIAFVKNMEQKYGRTLLDRNLVAYMDDQDQVLTIPLKDLHLAVKNGKLNMSTKVFDNLVATQKDFTTRWVVPLGTSWLKKFT